MNFFTTPHFLNKYAEEMRDGEKVHAKEECHKRHQEDQA